MSDGDKLLDQMLEEDRAVDSAQDSLQAERRRRHECEVALEQAVIERELNSQNVANLKTQLEDVALQCQAEVLEKEMRATQLEADLELMKVTAQQREKDLKEIDTLRDTVKKLSEWHAEVTSRALICEGELKLKIKLLNLADADRKQLAQNLEEVTKLCHVLEEYEKVNFQLTHVFIAAEQKLKTENQDLKNQVVALQQTLRESIVTLAEEKTRAANELTNTLALKQKLEKQLAEMHPQLLPMWDQMYQARVLEGRPSRGAWNFSLKLRAIQDQVNAQRGRAESELLDIVEQEPAGKQLCPGAFYFLRRLSLLQSLLLRMLLLGDYFFTESVLQWLEAYDANPQSIKKDKGVIRWMLLTIKDFVDAAYWINELCSWSVQSAFDVQKIFDLETIGTTPLFALLDDSVESVDVLVQACLQERLSEGLSTRSLLTLSQHLRQFLETRGHASGENLQPSASVQRLAFLRVALGGLLASLTSIGTADICGKILHEVVDALKLHPFSENMVTLESSRESVKLRQQVGAGSLEFRETLARFSDVLWSLEVASQTEDVHDVQSLSALNRASRSAPQHTELDPFTRHAAEQLLVSIKELSQQYAACGVAEADLLCSDMASLAKKVAYRGVDLRALASIYGGQVEAVAEGVTSTSESPGSPRGDAAPTDEHVTIGAAALKEASKWKSKYIMLEFEHEKLRKRARDFAEAEKTRQSLTTEIEKALVKQERLVKKNDTLDAKVKELTERLSVSEASAKELAKACKMQALVHPSLAALELCRMKAIMARLEADLIEGAIKRAEQDWQRIQVELNLPKISGWAAATTAQARLQEALQIRGDIIQAMVECPALAALRSAGGTRSIQATKIVEARDQQAVTLGRLHTKWVDAQRYPISKGTLRGTKGAMPRILVARLLRPAGLDASLVPHDQIIGSWPEVRQLLGRFIEAA